MSQLDDVVDATYKDTNAILNRPADELDHARSLEAGIEYIERLDKLIEAVTRRYYAALRQLELYPALQGALQSIWKATMIQRMLEKDMEEEHAHKKHLKEIDRLDEVLRKTANNGNGV